MSLLLNFNSSVVSDLIFELTRFALPVVSCNLILSDYLCYGSYILQGSLTVQTEFLLNIIKSNQFYNDSLG